LTWTISFPKQHLANTLTHTYTYQRERRERQQWNDREREPNQPFLSVRNLRQTVAFNDDFNTNFKTRKSDERAYKNPTIFTYRRSPGAVCVCASALCTYIHLYIRIRKVQIMVMVASCFWDCERLPERQLPIIFYFAFFFFRCHLRFYFALFLRTGLFRGIYKFMGSRTHIQKQQKSYSFNVVYTCWNRV